jgi:hydroxymethylbilane synthase
VAETLRVGTRPSPLALRQTEIVLTLLRGKDPTLSYRVVPLVTQGDRAGGHTGDFTDRLDLALEDGELDLVVHSAKDLPSRPLRRVKLAATPPRADPRDALVLRSGGSLRALPPGARIGSSSARRRAQLLAARPDLEVVGIRGNVGTRLAKMGTQQLAGVLLAVAGLERLGLTERITERLPPRDFLPAPGQGTLAVMARPGDRALLRRLRSIDHPATAASLRAEFAFTRGLAADCDTPLGALATVRGERLVLRAGLWSPDGTSVHRDRVEGPVSEAARLGQWLAAKFLAAGATPKPGPHR